MSRKCPRNFQDSSGKFLGIFWKIAGNVREMSGKCPGNVRNKSGTFPGNFREISGKCPGNFSEMSGKFPGNFQEISGKCPGNFPDKFLGHFLGSFLRKSLRIWRSPRGRTDGMRRINSNQRGHRHLSQKLGACVRALALRSSLSPVYVGYFMLFYCIC